MAKLAKESTIDQLIPINLYVINHKKIQTVNARDVWKFLESKREFATWIKNRIKKYEFTVPQPESP